LNTNANYRGNTGPFINCKDPTNPGIVTHYPAPPASAWDPTSIGQASLSEGIFKHVGVRINDIIDGTSNTAMCSERSVGDNSDTTVSPESDSYRLVSMAQPGNSLAANDTARTACNRFPNPTPYPIGGCQNGGEFGKMGPFSCLNWSLSGRGWNDSTYIAGLYNHISPPNSNSCIFNDRVINQFAIMPPSSKHPGGVNLVLCDASVRFVRNSISVQTWYRLGHRRDGEAVGEF
jgi:hypothetical protein